MTKDRVDNHKVVHKLRQANRQLDSIISSSGGGSSGERGGDIKMIDMKAMNPKVFDSKPASPCKAWAKKVRAYCSANCPGFRKFLKWIESQTDVIDCQVLSRFDWRYKDVVHDVLYDFLLLHTSDNAQELVELQTENWLESGGN